MSCCPESSINYPPEHVSNLNCKGKVVTASSNDPNSTPLEVYVTGQTDFTKTKRILVLFQCIYPFGTCLDFSVSDKFVTLCGDEKTTTVLFPDYFRGDAPMDPSIPRSEAIPLAFEKIKTKYDSKYFDMTINHTLLPWLEENGANLNDIGLSTLGFCFGAWVSAKCLASNTAWRCAVSFHPSLHVETLLGDGTIDELCEPIKTKPFFMMPAGDDPEELKPGGSIVKMLASARNVSEREVSFPFEDMVHGFAIRGDSNDEKIKAAQEKSYDLAADFVLKHHSV